eukprot:1386131-Amorphochlora_amoeboformis.AAC.2
MPKRKGKKKAPKAVQSENSSVAGSETATVVSDFSADLWEPEESSIEDVIKDLCEQLTEKRTSTRVNALTKLSKLLRSRYLPDEVEALLMTLQSRLSSTMRAKDSKEVKLGCLVMGLTAFSTIDILSEDIRRVLTTVAGDSTKRASIRAAALRTVALHAFLDNDEVEKDTILALAQVDHGLPTTRPHHTSSMSTNFVVLFRVSSRANSGSYLPQQPRHGRY